MTRLQGAVILVTVDAQGKPQRLCWQGQWHTVQTVHNHWRVQRFWWRGLLSRDYYRLTTRSGLLLVIVDDQVSGQWWVQTLYD